MVATEPSNTKHRIAVYLFFFVIAVLPVLFVEYPPLYDLPNHLARYRILSELDHSAHLQKFYVASWDILPNLGCDIIAKVLAPILSLSVISKLLVLLIISIGYWSMVFTQKGDTLSAVLKASLASAVLLNYPLFCGFINFSLGCSLLLLCTLLYEKSSRLSGSVRFSIAVFLSVVLFFCHLVPTLIFGLVVFSKELAGRSNSRSKIPRVLVALTFSGAQALVPLSALALLSPTGKGGDSMTWSSASSKVMMLLGPMRGSQTTIDLAVTGAIVVAVFVLLRQKQIRLSRSSLCLVFLVFAIFIVAPFHVLSVDNFDARLPSLVLLLFVSGIEVNNLQKSLNPFALLLAALVGTRSILYAKSWRESSKTLVSVRQLMSQLPSEIPVFALETTNAKLNDRKTWRPPLKFSHCLGIQDDLRFDSTLFVFPSQQPMQLAKGALGLNTYGQVTSGVEMQSQIDAFVLELAAKLKKLPLFTGTAEIGLVAYTGDGEKMTVPNSTKVGSVGRMSLYRVRL